MLQATSISSQWWVGKMYLSVGVFGAWANVRCTGGVCQYDFNDRPIISLKIIFFKIEK